MASTTTKDTDETLRLGERIGASLVGGETILLVAPLGAGKTVLAKGIAAGLGVSGVVTSPTFTLISEYDGRLSFVHVDLYRIASTEEYAQLAVDELTGSRTVVAIEWPERAGELLPDDAYSISIEVLGDGRRRIGIPDTLADAAGIRGDG